jgi:hypothetical protein
MCLPRQEKPAPERTARAASARTLRSLIDHRQDSYVEVVGPVGPFEIWIGGLDGRARCIPAKAQDSVTRSGRAQTPRHDAPDDRERLAARGTAHQQRMPLFAAQQPIGLALFCQ